ncbi:class I SAM-dependent DNA methyltransferase [Yoonia sp.]|uniref:class I SAM-dependent DNA methyltransferase n=1 Tax=Yoonia sp. TaxID=2212373 RepID=UPI00391B41B6
MKHIFKRSHNQNNRMEQFALLGPVEAGPLSHTFSAAQAKSDAILARLTKPHYVSVIEVGCAVGTLSALLQARCDRFLGIDLSSTAIERAKTRLAHCNNVGLRQVSVPHRWPRRQADLIVLSETLHHLSAKALRDLARCINSSLIPGSEIVVLVRPGNTDTRLSGAQAAQIFIHALAALRTLQIYQHLQAPGYVHYTLLCPVVGK